MPRDGQMCARDLARYTHPPMAPIAPGALQGPANAKALERIPTPKAVSDAFARIAAGLPPEPRKRLYRCRRVVSRSAASAQTPQQPAGVGG